MKATCTYTGRVVGDLADGRPVEPGEQINNVDLDEPHNQMLVDEGLLLVHEKPRRQASAEKKEATS